MEVGDAELEFCTECAVPWDSTRLIRLPALTCGLSCGAASRPEGGVFKRCRRGVRALHAHSGCRRSGDPADCTLTCDIGGLVVERQVAVGFDNFSASGRLLHELKGACRRRRIHALDGVDGFRSQSMPADSSRPCTTMLRSLLGSKILTSFSLGSGGQRTAGSACVLREAV